MSNNPACLASCGILLRKSGFESRVVNQERVKSLCRDIKARAPATQNTARSIN